MRSWTLVLVAAIAFGASSPLRRARAERPIVAVFDVQDKGARLGARDLDKLMDYMAARLAEGGYNVVPRDQLRRRLGQQKRVSYKTCYDQSCQIELGRELSAQKALATKILRIGKTCHVTSELFDLKRAATERAATAEASCGITELVGCHPGDCHYHNGNMKTLRRIPLLKRLITQLGIEPERLRHR